MCNKRQWIFSETACFPGGLVQMCPEFRGMPITKHQANPLGCEFLCNRSGITGKVLQGHSSANNKWFSGGDNLLKTSVCPRELLPGAEQWT